VSPGAIARQLLGSAGAGSTARFTPCEEELAVSAPHDEPALAGSTTGEIHYLASGQIQPAPFTEDIGNPEESLLANEQPPKRRPRFAITVFTILLPIILMMAASTADLAFDKQSALRGWIDFFGQPTTAMLIAVLFSFYSFGAAIGFKKEEILNFSNECLGPVAMVLLVVGAGGGFSKTLEFSGVGKAITSLVIGSHFSPILLGWILACLLRIAAGSATVAISTAAGIMAPIAAAVPGTNLELLVVAMGAGSGIFSHLNDGGFWFVKEYFNMTVPQTLKTWSVLTTIKAVVALLLVFFVNALLKHL
jgi:GntP family gluconate:H+ symporter